MAASLDSARNALLAGRLDDAAALCRTLLSQDPHRSAVKSVYALVLVGQKRYAEAERLLADLILQEPDEVSHHLNRGNLLLEQGRTQEAVPWLSRARALAPTSPDANYNLGMALYRLGESAAAAEILPHAIGRGQGSAEARICLARCQLDLGQRHAAHATLEAISDFEGLGATALNELGLACAALDEPTRAEQMFQRALRKQPRFHEAHINLASLAERANRIEDCRASLDGVEPASRLDPGYSLVRARLQARDGQARDALGTVSEALDRPGLGTSMSSDLLFEQGKLLDRLGRYAEAYVSFLEANAAARDHYRRFHPSEGNEDAPIPWLVPDFLDVDSRELPAPQAGAEPDPVFIVGFPRSGTTLLDQMLDSHPALQVLEEKPAIQSVVLALNKRAERFPKALADRSESLWSEMRALYWQTVSEYLQRRPGTVLVDKFPLNLVRLPVILRLFPRARLVVALRHPCDAVLSCFMQNFRFTESTHGFWSIGGTARIYDQVMREWARQREKYGPNCLEVRYEQLVTNFRSEVERLLGFLGLPWHDGVLRYHEHALGRAIQTPSYDQVVRPIYRDAVNRWHHYRPQFQGSLSVLLPHLQRLGYEV